jgi:hypothetical protein
MTRAKGEPNEWCNLQYIQLLQRIIHDNNMYHTALLAQGRLGPIVVGCLPDDSASVTTPRHTRRQAAPALRAISCMAALRQEGMAITSLEAAPVGKRSWCDEAGQAAAGVAGRFPHRSASLGRSSIRRSCCRPRPCRHPTLHSCGSTLLRMAWRRGRPPSRKR